MIENIHKLAEVTTPAIFEEMSPKRAFDINLYDQTKQNNLFSSIKQSRLFYAIDSDASIKSS